MTVQEAKEILEYYEKQEWFFEKDRPAKNAFTMAIECMEEVEQYRALGTVEELKEAREKQIPKKPIKMEKHENEIDTWVTCECGAIKLVDAVMHKQIYCSICGQLMKLDLEEGGTSE